MAKFITTAHKWKSDNSTEDFTSSGTLFPAIITQWNTTVNKQSLIAVPLMAEAKQPVRDNNQWRFEPSFPTV